MEAVEAAEAAAAREANDGEEEPLSKGRSEREEKARLRVMGLGLYFSGCRVALGQNRISFNKRPKPITTKK